MPKFAVNVTIYVEADDFEHAGDIVYDIMVYNGVNYEESTIYHVEGDNND